MSNRFNNKIQDGLDDLISGVTGIRRSKVGELKQTSVDFREKSDDKANEFGLAARYNAHYNASVEESKKIPPIHNMIQFPAMIRKEDASETDFRNYVHFRSLERRSKQTNDERWDISNMGRCK